MDFEEFNKKSNELIELLIKQKPLGIIKFGSTLNPEDYIPGISNLDLIVISKEPLKYFPRELSKILMFDYYFDTPETFIRGVHEEKYPTHITALKKGKIIYDPVGLLEEIKKKHPTYWELKPGEYTKDIVEVIIGDYLTSAINGYFFWNHGIKSKTRISKWLRSIYCTIKNIGTLEGLFFKNELFCGYTEIINGIKNINSKLTETLKYIRKVMENHEELYPEVSESTKIGDDTFGKLVKTVEKTYFNLFNSSNPTTNELIDDFQKNVRGLERILAVEINNLNFEHRILAKNLNENSYSLFGIRKRNHLYPEKFYEEIETENSLKKAYEEIFHIR